MIKQLSSHIALSEPMCAIGDIKDELNLATGVCTRRIKKLVLDGTEDWQESGVVSGRIVGALRISTPYGSTTVTPAECVKCSHIIPMYPYPSDVLNRVVMNQYQGGTMFISLTDEIIGGHSFADFVTYLQQQYANGTPMSVWYVLAEPTTETITVPEGLSGIIEGYLIQDGTPTPTNPIYPSSRDSVDIWNEIMYRQYGFNETISPIPTTIFSQGDGIDSCTVYGNAVQNEIPTYDNPIIPQGVGEMTENLLDKTEFTGVSATIEQIENGIRIIVQSSGYAARIILDVPQNTDYTISYIYNKISGSGSNVVKVFAGTGSSTEIVALYNKTGGTFNTGNNAKINIWFYAAFGTVAATVEYTNIMLNLGNTALPYEPYGQYKIPIVCDNQTTNIYLGETQSARVIKKLILTGEENWERQSGQVVDYFRIPNMPAIPSKVLCTHYVSPDDNIVYASSVTGIKMQQSATYGVIIACRPPNISSLTLAGFKQFLANEYAAGHPVTVYYVMATPETTILNEPLMKVEDYADSVVYGSNIPTTFGQNDIDVNTQIKPLKLDITYNALRRAKVYKNNRWILNPSIDWSQTLKISDLQSKKIKEMEGEYIGYNIHT